MPQAFVSTDRIRSLFTEAMSQMYRAEVPQYGTLIELVAVSYTHLTLPTILRV